jgi:hypothetical protein
LLEYHFILTVYNGILEYPTYLPQYSIGLQHTCHTFKLCHSEKVGTLGGQNKEFECVPVQKKEKFDTINYKGLVYTSMQNTEY